MVTFTWNDAAFPTPSVIPKLSFQSAHAKFSKANGSVSIWLTFDNAVRSSTVTAAFDHEVVVVKRVTPTVSLQAFKELPFDWEHIMTSPHSNVGSEDSVSDTKTLKRGSSMEREQKHPPIEDDLQVYIDELVRLRKRPKCDCVERIRSALGQ